MRLYKDFHTEQLNVPPYSSPTEVPLNRDVSKDPINTSNEITTPMYGGKKSRRRGGKWRKTKRSMKKTPRGGKKHRKSIRKSSHKKHRKTLRGGFSLPPFISDFTRGIQYGAEQLMSDLTTAQLASNRNPHVSAQPYLQSAQ